MKRIFSILLIILLVCGQAFGFGGNEGQKSRIWVFESNNSTGVYATTSVPTNLITVDSRILGYVITPRDPNLSSERIMGLYDIITDQTITIAELIVEAESGADNSGAMWFPYPLVIITSLEIRQGPNTTVLIYYEK